MTMRSKIGGLAAGFDPSLVQPRKTHEPKTAPGQMAQFSVVFQRVEEEARELRERSGKAQDIELTQIDDSPFQVRTITDDEVKELADNLAANPLATPVVVRKRGARFELVAGHRRKRAYELLGRRAIPAVVTDLDDEDSERAVVFDNLLAPSLPDYEKYLGVAKLRERHGWTYEEIAEKTGLSRSLVGYLFAFGKLPQNVQQILAMHPRLLGANYAAEMAKFASTDPQAVEAVVARIVAGEINPTQAVAALKAPSPALAAKAKPVAAVFKRGKRTYAQVAGTRGVITVKLADQGIQDAETLQTAIEALIKEHASRQ